ncbi:MAG: acylphosphatase [Rubrobacteraceae bacterium]
MRAPIRERRGISVRGIVQGVGFRPFVYALARWHGLRLVRNDAEGVHRGRRFTRRAGSLPA